MGVTPTPNGRVRVSSQTEVETAFTRNRQHLPPAEPLRRLAGGHRWLRSRPARSLSLDSPTGTKGIPAGDGRVQYPSEGSAMAHPGAWSADWQPSRWPWGGRRNISSPPIGPGEVAECGRALRATASNAPWCPGHSICSANRSIFRRAGVSCHAEGSKVAMVASPRPHDCGLAAFPRVDSTEVAKDRRDCFCGNKREGSRPYRSCCILPGRRQRRGALDLQPSGSQSASQHPNSRCR